MNFIYQKVTNLIIEKLQQGVVPWQKNFNSAYPKNFISDEYYRGINIMLLGMQDFNSHYWLTFKQAKDLGGNIMKDAHGSLVVFWKPVVQIIDNIAKDDVEANVNYILRYYYVFNLDQVILPDEVLKKKNITQTSPKIMEAEQVIKKYRNPPEIVTNNLIDNPRYLPRLDKIEIQSIYNFVSPDDYYSTLFHELIHSTGNEKKLSRKGITEKISFGTEIYSLEELVAEIGASYLCAISGIHKTIDNQSAYIANWLQVLNNDSSMILVASSQASKACDYILNISSTNSKEV